MIKPALALILLAIIACGSTLVGTAQLANAQTGTQVSGMISQNTTWTKANSPYTLTGNVLVSDGITLTVEAGTVIELGNYYIMVNGTLAAKGSSADKISFKGGSVSFTVFSQSWNEQTSTGSIVENANFTNSVLDISNSPKIANNTIYQLYIQTGSSQISYNTVIDKTLIYSGLSVISCNNFVSSKPDSFLISGGHSTITNNIFSGGSGISVGGQGSGSNISNNAVVGQISIKGFFHSCAISNNTITGTLSSLAKSEVGIDIQAGNDAYIYSNTVSGFATGISVIGSSATIEKNLIFNNKNGIGFSSQVDLKIQNNTIVNNQVGIFVGSLTSTIAYNNIVNNSQNSLYLSTSSNVNAAHNYWGTADAQAINQTFYDFDKSFNLGIVNFVPFLISSNPQAPTVPITPTASTTPVLTPTPIPNKTPAPTITPTSTAGLTSTPTVTQTVAPTQSPTVAPSNQPSNEGSQVWLYVVIAVMAIVIVLLLGTIALMSKKGK